MCASWAWFIGGIQWSRSLGLLALHFVNSHTGEQTHTGEVTIVTLHAHTHKIHTKTIHEAAFSEGIVRSGQSDRAENT